MSDELISAILLLLVGLGLIVAEIFLPSFGVLTVLSLLCLAGAIYEAFQFSNAAGYVAMLTVVVLLPLLAYMAVRVWHRTPFGRRIAPPNEPAEDPSQRPNPLRAVVGRTGVALTPLRPVGTCDFGGQRLQCMAETGMIARQAQVVAVGVEGQSLVVRPVETA